MAASVAQEDANARGDWWRALLLGGAILVALWATRLHGYLLFHSLAEIFSIVVAMAAFTVAWNSRDFADDAFLLFLGTSCLFAGIIDLLHTLAYSGMGVFPEHGTNLATQLWIAARYLQGLSLLAAPWFLGRKPQARPLFLGYTLVVAVLLAAIFHWRVFPDCFVEGRGLTSFKKASEYVICLFLAAAALNIYRTRGLLDKGVRRLLIAAILVTIASEWCFTRYADPYGPANQAGHLLKIIACYLVYRALIKTGLTEPYRLLFRHMKQNEEALRKREAQYRALVERTGILVTELDMEGRIVFANHAAEQLLGVSTGTRSDRSFLDVVHPDDREKARRAFEQWIRNKVPDATLETRVVDPSGKAHWILWTVNLHIAADQSVTALYAVGRDLTERKRAEEDLRVSHRFLDIANRHTAMVPLLEEFMAEIRALSGCDAVGIRVLDEDGNIPYQVYTGFSREFYERESPLSIDRDHCMCINVIRGATDPAQPFYTPHGSFYMNATTRFLATVSEEDKGSTRNVCNQVGYESVALMPIRIGGRIIGLFHIADTEENKVPLSLVQMLEGAAMQLGTAMQRTRAEEELKRARDELELRVNERTAELERTNIQLTREISEHARVLAQLRESEASLAEAQRIAHLGNWDWNVRTNELRWSDEVYRIFGLSPGEFDATYDAFLSRVHSEDRARVEESVNEALHAQKPYGIEHRIVQPNGEVRVVFEQGEVFSDKGAPTRMLGTVLDITERKRAEEEAKFRQQQLIQADKMVSLGILVSGVAHEINNPNHAIMLDASVLQEAWSSIQPILDRFYEEYGDFVIGGYEYSEYRERLPEMFSNILASSKRIQLIVQELRGFARQTPSSHMGLVDLNAVVKSATILVTNMVRKSTEHFSANYTENLPKVHGNFQRLEQVVINLVQNACQALPDKSARIAVSTLFDEQANAVLVEVLDEGVGISSEDLKHLTDPFYTTKRDSGGTGLGLWISSSIVHEHGGTLSFDSNRGRGTKATVVLRAISVGRPGEQSVSEALERQNEREVRP